jgi:hypothetical protein
MKILTKEEEDAHYRYERHSSQAAQLGAKLLAVPLSREEALVVCSVSVLALLVWRLEPGDSPSSTTSHFP